MANCAPAPRNQRVLLDEYARQRGQISAGGQLLAYSVSTEGRFRFLRVYPDPMSYAPVTGFYSLSYSSAGLERAEDTAKRIVKEHLDKLHKLAAMLLEKEIIDGKDVDEVIGRTGGSFEPAAAPAPTGG